MQMQDYVNNVTPLIPPTLALINTTIKKTLYCNLHFINEAHNLQLVKLRALKKQWGKTGLCCVYGWDNSKQLSHCNLSLFSHKDQSTLDHSVLSINS